MKKIWLEEYTDYLHEIDDLHEQRRKLPKATALVKGSSITHPYTKRSLTISGADRQQADKIDQKIEKLCARCKAVESFIENVKSTKMRNMLRWHYIDGESWLLIGRRIGKGEDAPRKRVKRFLEENCE